MIWEIDEKQETIEGLDAAGRPDPAYAAALGLLRAPFGRRALAAACDLGIWVLLQLPLWFGAVPLLLKLATGAVSPYGFVNHPGFVLAVVMASVTVLLTLVYGIVQLVLHGRRGVTIGKAVAGIRTVDVRTLERPGVGAVLLRFLIVGAAGIVPLFGTVFLLLSPTFDPQGRGRGWHDKATRVWLVDVRKGLQPYDEKRMRVARKMVKADPTPERSALPSLATPLGSSGQPQYRPGSRTSAGVLGVARPHDAQERVPVGLATPAAPAVPPTPVETGKPILGGYRMPDADRAADPVPHSGQPVTVPPSIAPQPAAPVAQPAAPVAQPAAPVAQAPAPAAPVVQPAAPVAQAAPVQPAAPVVQPVAPVRAPSQAAPSEPPQQPSASVPRFALRLDTGESIPISQPVLLGRNPDAGEYAGARAIALPDDSRSLSKTHLLVRPVEAGLEIVDWRSTNGSGLIRGGTEYAVAAGVPVATTVGDTIRIGDRTAVVERA